MNPPSPSSSDSAAPVQPETVVLVNAAREGDGVAWKRLFERYRGYLLYVVRMRLTGSPARGFDADDVLQEAFLKAFRRLEHYRYQGEGSFLRWLQRIVVNQLLNQIRGRGGENSGLEAAGLAGGSELAPSDQLTPSEVMMDQESQERLRLAFEALSETEQLLVGLRLGQGMKWAQIGEALECSRAVATQRYQQVIERLRRAAGPSWRE